MHCPALTAMIGIHGRASAHVDAVGPVCAPLNDKQPDSDHPILLGPTGGASGDAFRIVCPYDMVVRGLRVRAGALIDSVGIACGTL